jgi:2'-5' RNA ligase
VWFDPRRPRVLAVVLHDASGALAELHDSLWGRLEPLGHRRERRRFRPHVTVARVRHGARPLRRELPAVGAGPFSAQDLTLMRSHLQGGAPALYEPLERVALGGVLPGS